jgi:hypothetical protein
MEEFYTIKNVSLKDRRKMKSLASKDADIFGGHQDIALIWNFCVYFAVFIFGQTKRAMNDDTSS